MAPATRRRARWNDDLLRKHATPTLSPCKPVLTDAHVNMAYSTLEAREASFLPPTKRAKGWPHKSPSPQDLAKAGFFWKPTSSKDNVECFMCGRHLDGWEEDDDALQEHLKHGSDCAWALLMAAEAEGAHDTSNMDDPTGPQLTEARRNTFETLGWPHEGKRGWTCKTDKMVEAGWHFAPTTECDDYTSCVYCKLSLDGWEPKDNPFEEHHRRSPNCAFFVFAGTTAPSKRPKKKGGRASRTSRTSKTSRISTQSNTTTMSQPDESTGIIEILGEDTTLEHALDTSIVSLQSTTSTATTKGKRKAPGRAKTALAKKSKTTKSKKIHQEAESRPEEEEESLAIEEHAASKKSRSKKKQLELELDTQDVMVAGEAPPQPPPKKSRSKKRQPTPEPEPVLGHEIEQECVEAQPKRRSSGRRQKEATPEPEPAVEEQMKRELSQEQPRRRSSRRKTQEPTPEQEREPKHEPDLEPEQMQVDQAQPQEEESAQYPTLPGEFPEETPDNFEDAEEEHQPEEGNTPQPESQTMGPPDKEGTPIAVNQISPLKEQTNPPRPSFSQDRGEKQRHQRRSSRRSSAKQRRQEQSPSQPSDEENRPPSSLPKEKRPPLSSPGAPPPSWTPVDVDTIFQNNVDIDLFGGAVNGTLSEKEKDMTVHEWIEHVAGQAEASLGAEAERIVSVFEREGQRAMAAVEGIQCV